jgi:hypothetical protein
MKMTEGIPLQHESTSDPGTGRPKPVEGESRVGNYSLLETYLRKLPVEQEDVILTFDSIEAILQEPLPDAAREDHPWWQNQKRGFEVETIAWMDAGWMVEIVDLRDQWVRFVRQ